VSAVNHPKIGLCLDTFQIAGGEYGDPCSSSRIIFDRGLQQKLEMNFSQSLAELSAIVPSEKIYLLQISDAYKPPAPFRDEEDENGMRPRGRWSHDFRPYPFKGGYLPVVQVAKAVLETGVRDAWLSMEVFDGGRNGKWEEKRDLGEFCKGAMRSHLKVLDECADAP